MHVLYNHCKFHKDSMGLRSIPSRVRYYCFLSALVLVFGFWVTTTCIWVPEKLSVAQFPASVSVVRVTNYAVANNLQEEGASSSNYWHPHGRHGRAIKSLEPSKDRPKEEVQQQGETPEPVEVSREAELVALQGSLPKLYHSPEVFSLSYEEMWNRLQVWVYPSAGAGNSNSNSNSIHWNSKYEHMRDDEGGGDVAEELSSTADLFFRLLARSEFVTEDPARAQLFLLPVSIDALWVELNSARIADQLRRYVQRVRTEYPYWDLSLGADHFYLSCHAFEHNTSRHRNILELGKNAIQAACAPLRQGQIFFPHKDLVFPEYKPVTEHEVRAALRSISSTRRRGRTTLAYFGVPPEVAMPGVLKSWKSDPDFELEADHPAAHDASYYRKLARSRFCVISRDSGSLNVVDALRFGCVPVFLSNTVFYDLPFQDVLNWRQFAVVLGMEELPNLKTVLAGIPPERYREMQYLGHQASKHLEWNNPPVPYDAFHMTLVELWVRRHSIKYARRNSVNSS